VAELLGTAAAPNLVVGRLQWADPDRDGSEYRLTFDDGDEILVESGSPPFRSLLVTSHVGSFTDYERPLVAAIPDYAEPILRRAPSVPDPHSFADVYVRAFEKSFRRIQTDYRARLSAYRRLFSDRPVDRTGSFGDRWHRVLDRLDDTDPDELVEALRGAIGNADRADPAVAPNSRGFGAPRSFIR
jgi:hypothetical protein